MGAGLQRIDLLTEPAEVGRYYMVPTVEYRWHDWDGHWPVMGPRHDDGDHLKFPHAHYHVDWRFLPARIMRRLSYLAEERMWEGPMSTEAAIIAGPLHRFANWPASGDRASVPHPPPVWKRLLMKRSAVFPRAFVDGYKGGRHFRDMFAAYAGRTAVRGKHGLICPHKKFSLGSIPPDADGIVTCPLHGLRICAATGAVEPQVRIR